MTVTLITGASKGIGFETARQLVELGHDVYLGARDAERGELAASAIGRLATLGQDGRTGTLQDENGELQW